MEPTPPAGPFTGLKVIDAATLFAGPGAATLLADYGADVLKIEHPSAGDPVRRHGYSKDGVSLWWKVVARNKRAMTLNLGVPAGRDILLALAAEADVLVENFRPGTMERWGLGWDELRAVNPGLIFVRVTGFGQFGPSARRPGFGTLAEAMSGFAYSTGAPDGPPTLPPFGLADGIAALTGAFAISAALHARRATGRGQVVDLAIIEPILQVVGPQVTLFRELGVVEERNGSRSVHNAPRNVYRTRDGRWLAISTSAQSIAERVMRLVGRPELVDEPWFSSGAGRVAHVEELDAAVGSWIAARTAAEVTAAFEEAQAAVAPVYSAADIVADEQYAALGTVVDVPDDELGSVAMVNVPFRLQDTPGRIRFAGRAKGADTDAVLTGLGYDDARREALRENGVI
ncbi:CoA transferase [Actinomadura rayongensis]|uniref:CoA transferase n=1 Tax=Actinomadura rayongensis TaxID=1429076 RepID=A0A6I4WDN2_9ACTN|nr:CoA transferase [Actinomadura rayongensis]